MAIQLSKFIAHTLLIASMLCMALTFAELYTHIISVKPHYTVSPNNHGVNCANGRCIQANTAPNTVQIPYSGEFTFPKSSRFAVNKRDSPSVSITTTTHIKTVTASEVYATQPSLTATNANNGDTGRQSATTLYTSPSLLTGSSWSGPLNFPTTGPSTTYSASEQTSIPSGTPQESLTSFAFGSGTGSTTAAGTTTSIIVQTKTETPPPVTATQTHLSTTVLSTMPAATSKSDEPRQIKGGKWLLILGVAQMAFWAGNPPGF